MLKNVQHQVTIIYHELSCNSVYILTLKKMYRNILSQHGKLYKSTAIYFQQVMQELQIVETINEIQLFNSSYLSTVLHTYSQTLKCYI